MNHSNGHDKVPAVLGTQFPDEQTQIKLQFKDRRKFNHSTDNSGFILVKANIRNIYFDQEGGPIFNKTLFAPLCDHSSFFKYLHVSIQTISTAC